MRLFDQSQITATAGGTGDGGNITIDADTITALDNSEITANAIAGDGGEIEINTQGLFVSPNSQITASSELGIDGTIEINIPDTNQERELEHSTPDFIVTEEAIANSCLSRRDRIGILTIGSSEGLPQSPSSTYTSPNSTLTGINSLPKISTDKPLPNTRSFRHSSPPIPIVADTFVQTEDGRIFAVAKSQRAKPIFCEPLA